MLQIYSVTKNTQSLIIDFIKNDKLYALLYIIYILLLYIILLIYYYILLYIRMKIIFDPT